MLVTIREIDTRLKRSDREDIERGLRFNLTRYEGHVARADVAIEETTVGKANLGYRVRVRVVLRSGERIAVEDTQRLWRDAVDRGIGRAARIVRQRLQRPRDWGRKMA